MAKKDQTTSHETFIEDLSLLIDHAKEALTSEFRQGFDLQALLEDPSLGKSLMSQVNTSMIEYIQKAQVIGNHFGAVKEDAFNARSASS